MKKIGFFSILFLFLVVRLLPIMGNRFPFSYDNAKDSLAMRTMWETKKPVFLGPVTSLEGLYQGPLWYYLALPANVLLSFHPFAGVLTVLILASIALYLLYAYVGVWEALLFTISTGFITTQQTSWAPYWIQFPVLFLVCWLWIHVKQRSKKQMRNLEVVLIAAALGSMFHSEIAFAIIFLPLFCICLRLNKFQVRRKQILIGLFIFILFFVPHFLFEIKHQFLQTRGVIAFVTHFKSQQAEVTNNLSFSQRVIELTSSLAGNIPEAISPTSFPYQTLLLCLIVLITAALLYKHSPLAAKRIRTIIVPIIMGVFLFYLVFPFKPFYLISLMPIWILLAATVLRKVPAKLAIILAVVIVGAAMQYAYASTLSYKKLEQTHFVLLASQLKAVDAAYILAAGRPFASYQYVPEVYDFTYQVDYLFTADTLHRPLPTEFGYLPGQTAYNPWDNRVEHTTNLQILIVEKDERPNFFVNWWDTMTKNRVILAKSQVNEAITVYLTGPKVK